MDVFEHQAERLAEPQAARVFELEEQSLPRSRRDAPEDLVDV